MNKTLKQIADELNIDKQKLYRFVKKNGIEEVHQESTSKSTSKAHQVKYYDETAQTLIKQAFCTEEVHQENTSEVHQEHISDTVLEVLLKQSETLKNELDIKNKQIEELNLRLAESQRLLDQQQKLNLVTEQRLQQLLLEENTEPEETAEPQKSWWQFWKAPH